MLFFIIVAFVDHVVEGLESIGYGDVVTNIGKDNYHGNPKPILQRSAL